MLYTRPHNITRAAMLLLCSLAVLVSTKSVTAQVPQSEGEVSATRETVGSLPLVAPASALPGVPTDFYYTALGDSLASGYPNENSSQYGYVSNYRNYFDSGNVIVTNLNLTNLGVDGYTSSQLINSLKTDQRFRNSVTNAQIITFDIGGNDLNNALQKFAARACGGVDNQDCLRTGVSTFKQNWSAIIAEIKSLRGTNSTAIRTMDVYNPFVSVLKASGALPVAKPYLDDVNNYIATTSAANNIPVAKVYLAFNGPNGDQEADDKGYLTFDHFHPSDLGHRVIANLFSGLGYAPFTATITSTDLTSFFVRQQYLDFLNRDADASGFNYWTGQINGSFDNPPPCGGSQGCANERRTNVSAAFFLSAEFQDTGYFVYRFYVASYGRQPSFNEFVPDRNQVVGGANLEASKQAFADAWVKRNAFLQAYPQNMSNADFVNKLYDTAALKPYTAERLQQISAMTASGKTRAQVLRETVETQELKTRESNPAFVLMQYFGYLKRDPEEGGYQFWLNVLNNKEPNNFRGMVCSFITSTEYQLRFGTAASHSNAECPAAR